MAPMVLRGAASSAQKLPLLTLLPMRSAAPTCAWRHQQHHEPAACRPTIVAHAFSTTSSSNDSSSSSSSFSSCLWAPANTACSSNTLPACYRRPHVHGLAAGLHGPAAWHQQPRSTLAQLSFASGGVGPTPEPWPYPDVQPLVLSPTPCRVVVIGWMGSKARYVRKYEHLWQGTGDHAVLTIRPTIIQTMVRFRGVVKAGSDIDRVARLQIENPAMPTFYHIFSTGGFTHAGTMWRWMDEVEDLAMRENLLGEVAGIILDSVPSRVTEQVVARAVVSAVSGVPAEDVDTRLGAAVAPLQAFLKVWLSTKGIRLRQEEVFDAWLHRAPSCPQLYLYSDADPLVDPSYVEEYIKVQEGRGVAVTSHKFSGSGHCEHYRRHPQEYAMQLSQFVSKALAAW